MAADFKGAAQSAMFQALSASAELAAVATVYQHVEEDAVLNEGWAWVVIGDLSAEPWGGKDGGLDRVTVEIFIVANELDQTALTSVQALVRSLIEDVELPRTPGVQLSRPTFEGEDAGLEDEGLSYSGIQRFSLFAQPEDPLLFNGDFGEAGPPPVLAAGTGTPEISGGKLVFHDAGTARWSLSELEVGGFYRFTGTIDSTDGTVALQAALSSQSIWFAEAGSIEWFFIPTAASTDFVLTTGGTGTLIFDAALLEGPLTPTGEGPELVTGGDAASAAGWTVTGTNASIADGVFRAAGGSGAKSFLRPASAALVPGRPYRGRLDVVARVSGSANLSIGGAVGGSFTSVGSKQVDLVAGATQDVGATIATLGNQDLDNISVKEILFD